jgi:hypothetical protein
LSVQRPSGTFSTVESAEDASSLSSSLDLGLLHIGDQSAEKSAFDVETAIVQSDNEVRNHRGKDSALIREIDSALSSKISASKGSKGEKTSPLDTLAAAERERCHLCGGKRQIYCGDCGGIRVGQGGELLPRRIVLPFDLLLIVHWLVLLQLLSTELFLLVRITARAPSPLLTCTALGRSPSLPLSF